MLLLHFVQDIFMNILSSLDINLLEKTEYNMENVRNIPYSASIEILRPKLLKTLKIRLKIIISNYYLPKIKN